MSDRFFKKAFGHERSESGKMLDRTVLVLLLIVATVVLYSCYG